MQQAIEILLVEDDEIDVLNFQRQARKASLDVPITVARDGAEALRILRRSAPGEPDGGGVPRYVIFTDLNMPGMTGHELIEAIRRDAALRRSIVFVLTSSGLGSDVARAYDSNIAGYIVKDAAGSRIRAAVEMLKDYLACVRPPAG